jgi:hypothetical protein
MGNERRWKKDETRESVCAEREREYREGERERGKEKEHRDGK